MNIQSTLRKIYNKIKYIQIEEDDLTPENFGAGAFNAGMLYSAKLFMKCYNGEMTEEELNVELAKLESAEVVN